MRLLFGMILGAALTIGGAFLHDTWVAGPAIVETPPSATEQRAMVNWDVVGDSWRRVRDHVREAWTALSHKVNG